MDLAILDSKKAIFYIPRINVNQMYTYIIHILNPYFLIQKIYVLKPNFLREYIINLSYKIVFKVWSFFNLVPTELKKSEITQPASVGSKTTPGDKIIDIHILIYIHLSCIFIFSVIWCILLDRPSIYHFPILQNVAETEVKRF